MQGSVDQICGKHKYKYNIVFITQTNYRKETKKL